MGLGGSAIAVLLLFIREVEEKLGEKCCERGV
jgi:hypothetical protein